MTLHRASDIRSSWRVSVLQQTAQLAALPSGWDGDGAPPPDAGCLAAARDLLEHAASADTPAPAMIPTSAGGVQLEWHQDGIDLEVEVLAGGRIDVSFRDSRRAEQWDRELAHDGLELREALAQLGARARMSA